MQLRLTRLAAGSVLLCFACEPEPSTPDDSAQGALAASLSVALPDHQVSAVRFLVLSAGDDCAGSPLATSTVSLAGTSAGAEPHTFADTLFVLPEGAYTICAVPLSGDQESDACAPGTGTVQVTAGATEELTLVSQCVGPDAGGAGVLVELNDPPQIDAVTIDPARSISICEALDIAVSTVDPNQDPVQVAIAVSEGPTGYHLSSDGAHARFSGPAGEYTLLVTATDSHEAESSLSFPVHIAEATCAVPSEVQAIFEARCAPCHIAGSSGGLKLTPAAASFVALVGKPSSAAACAERTLVVPGDAASSYLLAKLRGSPDICGSAMPRGRPMLPEEELASIEAWIDALPQ